MGISLIRKGSIAYIPRVSNQLHKFHKPMSTPCIFGIAGVIVVAPSPCSHLGFHDRWVMVDSEVVVWAKSARGAYEGRVAL